MHKGDFLTTPIWSWHDHGNEGPQPVMWLDGLDLPFVAEQDAIFFEEFGWTSDGREVQPVARQADDSSYRWGSNLRPTWEKPSGSHSPILNYRWSATRASPHALREDPGSPFDGIIMEYINPYTGGPTLPTMAAYLQLLRKGEHTKAHRHTSSSVYFAVRGSGQTIVNGQPLAWEQNDIFAVPPWMWHEHVVDASAEAVLFVLSDLPVLEPFGLNREEAYKDNDGRQPV
jgi:gentisate 1,2-dioxygenase